VTSPFKVQFGLSGMGVAPAGVQAPNTGHHHIIIDTQLTSDQLNEPIPMDAFPPRPARRSELLRRWPVSEELGEGL